MMHSSIERRQSEVELGTRIKFLDREAKLLLQLLEGKIDAEEVERLRGEVTRLYFQKKNNSMNELVSIVTKLYQDALRLQSSDELKEIFMSFNSTGAPTRIIILERLLRARNNVSPIAEAK